MERTCCLQGDRYRKGLEKGLRGGSNCSFNHCHYTVSIGITSHSRMTNPIAHHNAFRRDHSFNFWARYGSAIVVLRFENVVLENSFQWCGEHGTCVNNYYRWFDSGRPWLLFRLSPSSRTPISIHLHYEAHLPFPPSQLSSPHFVHRARWQDDNIWWTHCVFNFLVHTSNGRERMKMMKTFLLEYFVNS